MLDAIVFDFDGVVVDSEPVHLECFRAVLAGEGIELSTEDYYTKYLGFDDHDCFVAVLRDNSRPIDEGRVAEMIGEKTALVQKVFAGSIRPLAGAVELMRAAREAGAAVAICSGALREEIEIAGRTVGALELVDVLVAARDVSRGKPDPEGYVLAVKLLGENRGRPVDPASTWVVEDTVAGVQAARGAGCRVLAVTNSYARDALAEADIIVDSLADVALDDLPGPAE